MATLIFDIETVGEQWDDIDLQTQEVLTRWIERTAKSDSERESSLQALADGLGFSPLTGFIVAIGVYDLERKQGAVYYSGDKDSEDHAHGEYILKQRGEKEMLEAFWEGALSYDTFVTFNGRSFDVPFLLHRCVVHGIVPPFTLMEGRYLYQQKTVKHVDLQDQLTFYGAMFRKPSLHLFCRAYGIKSPKVQGVGGDDVAELFANKKFRDIALYNARDVEATTLLYEKWLQHLAPAEFKEREIDF